MLTGTFQRLQRKHRPARRSGLRGACFETLEGRRLLSFSPAVNHPVGTSPEGVVTADFNGDNKLDIATVNAGSNNVSVLLGNGAGGFGASQQFPATLNTSARSPSSLAVADFDGDTHPDLAVLFDVFGVYILKGNGNGTFQSPVRHGPGAWDATGLAVGDFNGDHKMDLVYTDSDQLSGIGGSVFVLLNNGQGGFTELQGGLVPSYGLAVADVNNDGKLDVVTAWNAMLGNGDGTLGETTQHGFSADPDFLPRAIAIGNMTGDSFPDLVNAAASVQVLPGLGNGRFSGTMLPGNATTFYTAVAMADFNADGKLDAVATDSTADVYLSNGDGTMRSLVPFTVGTSPAAVAVGDFNGDGRPDVATANAGSNNVSVLLNDGNWATKTYIGPASGGNWSTAGNWSPSGAPISSDLVTIVGKSVDLGASATVANLTLTGGAALNVAANGNRVFRASSVSISGANSKLNLNDNDLIVDQGSFTTIRSLVFQGFGPTATTGITSSTSNGSQILALFDNSLVHATQWQGQTLASNSIVGKYTYFGDVNIDGQVTGDDYTVIDANLNTTPAVGLAWLRGDMNLDGSVTGDDYTVIDSRLGFGVGNPLSPMSAPSSPEALHLREDDSVLTIHP